ncbi:hypothetical protein BpHYR1_006931, partial [Brachionus plicatilis]
MQVQREQLQVQREHLKVLRKQLQILRDQFHQQMQVQRETMVYTMQNMVKKYNLVKKFPDNVNLAKWPGVHPQSISSRTTNFIRDLKKKEISYYQYGNDFETMANEVASKCAGQIRQQLFKTLKNLHEKCAMCALIEPDENFIDILNENKCLFINIFFRFYYLCHYTFIDVYLQWQNATELKNLDFDIQNLTWKMQNKNVDGTLTQIEPSNSRQIEQSRRDRSNSPTSSTNETSVT